MTIPTNIKEWLAFKPLWFAVGLIALAIFLWWVAPDGTKEGELLGNVGVEDGRANIQEKIVEEKSNAVNEAKNTLNDSVNRPSGEFDGNTANARYCLNFPKDCAK